MLDNIIDFWEDHKKLCIAIVVVVVLVVVMLVVRNNNLQRKADEEAARALLEQQQANKDALQQDVEEVKEPEDKYQSSLGLDADKWKDERVDVTDSSEEEEEPPPVVKRTPRYAVGARVFGFREVPSYSQDPKDRDCFNRYYGTVTLADFGTFWGSSLTQEDFIGNTCYYVGVAEEDYNPINNIQSVGWLISNFSTLQPNDTVQFTNLHVIGTLSKSHVALLCSYDWYSAYGLQDTLVVFEDISGTLDVDGFKAGDIFEATVFVHNIKILDDVAGERVVVVQYQTYPDDLFE